MAACTSENAMSSDADGDASAPTPGSPLSFEASAALRQAARALEYDPARYFSVDQDAISIPVERLLLSRARPEGISNAVVRMADASRGRRDRRGPIRARALGDGMFLVLDGNSTVVIASLAGWPDVPCVVEHG